MINNQKMYEQWGIIGFSQKYKKQKTNSKVGVGTNLFFYTEKYYYNVRADIGFFIQL